MAKKSKFNYFSLILTVLIFGIVSFVVLYFIFARFNGKLLEPAWLYGGVIRADDYSEIEQAIYNGLLDRRQMLKVIQAGTIVGFVYGGLLNLGVQMFNRINSWQL